MKSIVKEFLEPSINEKQELWEKAIFVFDTNVLLNLYRYSAKTRNSLLEAFESFKERVWIPYQVAFEYMRRRCEVIYESVQRYDQYKKDIGVFLDKTKETLRLTSNDDEISELSRYLYKWLDSNKDKNLLVLNADNDEILDKILDIFDGRVGDILSDEEMNQIKNEGQERYKKSIPPGYKDEKKKQKQEEDSNEYGDLIIWKQIMKYSKENTVGIVFVTHDQKEDWWNIVKGRTIGPRIELRREFIAETHQVFHMYSMNSFISTYNTMNEKPIDKSAVEEVYVFEKSLQERRASKKKNRSYTINERIARTEETILKIESRIARRKNVLTSIENKFQNQGVELPNNTQVQYDNTNAKMKELIETLEQKKKELAALKEMMAEISSLGE